MRPETGEGLSREQQQRSWAACRMWDMSGFLCGGGRFGMFGGPLSWLLCCNLSRSQVNVRLGVARREGFCRKIRKCARKSWSLS